MTNERFLPILALLLATPLAQAQNHGSIQGNLIDESGTPVEFAAVTAERGGDRYGTTTDEQGRFTLKPLPPGIYTVRFAFTGMQTRELTDVLVNPDKITLLRNERMSAMNMLGAIAVEARRWEPPLIDPEEPSKLTIVASQFEDNPQRKNPAALIATTSPDIYKAPGSDELYFRGSRSDAMVYFVDGVKVSGRLSGVPPAGIASITMYTGGLPAKYGDVTGGVVAIETKSYFDLYMQERSRQH
jgi:hypothetical protein